MVDYWGPAVAGSQIRLTVTWSQSTSGNYSDVRFRIFWHGNWSASSDTWVALNASGTLASGNIGYRALSDGTLVYDYTHRYYHNASGALTLTGVSAAIDSVFGAGARSVSVGNIALPTIPRQPSAPTRPWRHAGTHNSLTIYFSHQGSIGATKFELQRSTNSNFSSATTISSTGQSTITGLTPGTTYYFRARSGNSAGWSAWGPTLTTYTTPQANQPTLDTVTATGMRVTFGRTGNAQGSTTWEIQYADNSSFSNATTVSSTGTSTLSGLTPGTTYYVRVRGKNSAGTGPWSATTSVATATVEAPGLSIASSNDGAAATATIMPPQLVTVSSYVIEAEYLAPAPIPPGANKSVSTTSNPAVVPGLIPGATYRWRAQAKIGSYTSPWSDWITVIQVNPNTLDERYFDSTSTSTDPDITYATQVIQGATTHIENAITPKKLAGVSGVSTIRRLSDSFVESLGSTRAARVKLIRSVSSGWVTLLRVQGDGYTYLGDDIYFPVLPAATYTLLVVARSSVEVTLRASASTLYQATPADIATDQNDFQGDSVTLVPGVPTVVSLKFRTPDRANFAFTGIDIQGPVTSGAVVDFDGILFALGRFDAPFDGGTSNTFEFLHEWEGAAQDSISARYRLFGEEPDPFQDPNCPQPPPAPRPPLPENDCIPDVLTWRRYWSPLTSGEVSAAFDVLPTFTLNTGALPDGPIRISVFENPDNTSAAEFVPGAPVSEQTVSFMPANAFVTLDAVSERAYGGSHSSATTYDVGHLVFGSDGGPASWPVLRCNMEYMIAVDVPATSPLGNISLEAELTTRMA